MLRQACILLASNLHVAFFESHLSKFMHCQQEPRWSQAAVSAHTSTQVTTPYCSHDATCPCASANAAVAQCFHQIAQHCGCRVSWAEVCPADATWRWCCHRRHSHASPGQSELYLEYVVQAKARTLFRIDPDAHLASHFCRTSASAPSDKLKVTSLQPEEDCIAHNLGVEDESVAICL